MLTGDPFVMNTLLEADVKGDAATVVAAAAAGSRAARRAAESFGLTTSLDTLKQLWCLTNNAGSESKLNYATWQANVGEELYNPWVTPLGPWDAASGRPSYIMTEADKKARPDLAFTNDEMNGLYSAVKTALDVNKVCPDILLRQEDLELTENSAVSLAMLGGNTCWHSSLGYYYYDSNNPPTDRKDIHVIMLFPNTQDGCWTKGNGAKNNYNGNIGVSRGDMVQLKYYPNIANGDLTTVSEVFPKGTKIGFMLKTNGWGMRPTVDDKKYYVEIGYGPRRYNNWCASTSGLSYCGHKADGGNYKYGYSDYTKSRMAKFSYTRGDDRFTIVSFEDALNDINFSDVVFALKPVNVFQELPEPSVRETMEKGVYCFEDLWPSKGDYDMNDAVVAFKHYKAIRKEYDWKEEKIMKQTFQLTTYQNYVELTNGLAVRINAPVAPSSVVMKKVKNGEETTATFVKDGDVYLLTEDFKGELGTTYVLELVYNSGIAEDKLATAQPFIFRNQNNGKRWEVHIVGEKPSDKMDYNLFGKSDDLSDPAKDLYFVSEGSYPFAFFLNNADISVFQPTILLRQNERKPIDELFPNFLKWSTSNGTTNQDWYVK